MSKCSYTDQQFIEAVQNSVSIAEVCRRIGIVDKGGNYRVVHKKIDELKLDTSHFTGKAWNQGKKYRKLVEPKSLDEILVENSYFQSYKLKARLLTEGLKECKCERCGRTTWEEEKIPLELHHINGNPSDNRLENLQILCPNCHALTDNYRAKNIHKNIDIKEEPEIKMKELSGEELRIYEEARLLSKRKGIKISEAEELIRNSPNKSIEDFPKKSRSVLEDKICPICGKTFHPKSKDQKYCSVKCVNQSQSKIPSKEEFLIVVKELQGNFTQIGKRFGVTDNAIRKWCAKYNIPTHKKELVKYIIDNLKS